MIRYALKCKDGHAFESWFQNASAYEGLHAKNLITCPQCGVAQVKKAIMAPRVSTSKETRPADKAPDLSMPETPEAKKMAELRKKIENESEYVGMQFAKEARAMHDGDAPERAIYGEAQPQEAIKLLEDGVKVTPLPFIPGRKTN